MRRGIRRKLESEQVMIDGKKRPSDEESSRDGRKEPALTRRSFLSKFWPILGGVAVVEIVFVVLDFIRPHAAGPGGRTSDIFVAGPLDRFEPGTVTAFPRGKFYLARLADGGVLAVSRACTHLGCTVPWDAGSSRFVCPCHASAFDITGDVLSPPAPRALDLYPVRIENGIVKVDVSKPLKRRSFQSAQAAYA
jgi:cytochrome b6-f complex iron-sulfur subunit